MLLLSSFTRRRLSLCALPQQRPSPLLLLVLLNKFICGIFRALQSLQYFHQVLVSSSVPLCCLLLCLSALPVENCSEQKSAPHLVCVTGHSNCGHCKLIFKHRFRTRTTSTHSVCGGSLLLPVQPRDLRCLTSEIHLILLFSRRSACAGYWSEFRACAVVLGIRLFGYWGP